MPLVLALPRQVEGVLAALVQGNEELGAEVSRAQWQARLHHLLLRRQKLPRGGHFRRSCPPLPSSASAPHAHCLAMAPLVSSLTTTTATNAHFACLSGRDWMSEGYQEGIIQLSTLCPALVELGVCHIIEVSRRYRFATSSSGWVNFTKNLYRIHCPKYNIDFIKN